MLAPPGALAYVAPMPGEGQTRGGGLRLEGLACLRGDRLLFEDVELDLGAGGAAVVVGANGAGKSSLLRVAAGLLRASAGRVTARGGIGWLGEATALDEASPLRAALGFWGAIDRCAPGRVDAALELVGLSALAAAPVRMLSTGQRRRAALARVIAGGAGLWLLDEPGNGLDVSALAALASAIAGHRADGGAVVVATHQPLDLPDATVLRLGT